MLRICAAAVAIVLSGCISVQAQQAAPPTGVSTVTYDSFMRLDATHRMAEFNRVGPESKAMLVRTHAERWLAGNRARLSSSEIKVFQEVIAFVTPEIYQKPLDPKVMKREADIKEGLKCRVNINDVVAMFDMFGRQDRTATATEWTYLRRAKCWVEWFAEGIVGYLPTIRR